MTYTVLASRDTPDEWRVEAIGSDGECYVTIFSGPSAKERAHEYAAWKTGRNVKYCYSFSVWPCEKSALPKAAFMLCEMFGRVEIQFTESDFNTFRFSLDAFGLTLREIERVPYCEPESVP